MFFFLDEKEPKNHRLTKITSICDYSEIGGSRRDFLRPE